MPGSTESTGRCDRAPRRSWLGDARRPSRGRRLRGGHRHVRGRPPLPQSRDHGSARLRAREYKYFAYPLPEPVAALRSSLYPRLAPSESWNEALGIRCATRRRTRTSSRVSRGGQARPTPLLLQYGEGDFNASTRTCTATTSSRCRCHPALATRRGFHGGEFVLTEQRPRMQSRAEVVPLGKATASSSPSGTARPGRARAYRVNLRHGVSRLRSAVATRSGSSSTTRGDGAKASSASTARAWRRSIRRTPSGTSSCIAHHGHDRCA